MITYFARDLLWASRIKALADDLALPARPVRTVEMLDARLSDSPVTGLLLDLDEPQTALALLRHLRGRETAADGTNPPEKRPSRVLVVAFGPHVETGDLRAAAEAGADRVMTRGQFHTQMSEILHLLAKGPVEEPGR